MLPWFLPFEYNLPNFPDDYYGFTKEDRLHYGQISLDYLFNDEGIEFLGDLTFPDGSQFYNERELIHMEDVKVVTTWTMRVWLVSIVLLIVALITMYPRNETRALLGKGLRGGVLFLGAVILGLIAFMLIDFDAFFTAFHRIFFEGDSWLFRYDDSLIRLYPIKLWSDAFIIIGVATFLESLGFLWLANKIRPN